MRFVSLYTFLRESINISLTRCHILFGLDTVSLVWIQFLKKVLKSLTGDCLSVIETARCWSNLYYPLSTLLIKVAWLKDYIFQTSLESWVVNEMWVQDVVLVFLKEFSKSMWTHLEGEPMSPPWLFLLPVST